LEETLEVLAGAGLNTYAVSMPLEKLEEVVPNDFVRLDGFGLNTYPVSIDLC
jgi:hypothetical protein